MRATQHPGLYLLKNDKKGRSVHSANLIRKGDLIEICPIIKLSKKDLKRIHRTVLFEYYFLWGRKLEKGAIALGYGSLYNHADKPNARFQLDLINDEIHILCKRKISPGQEITISYTDESRSDVKLWFKPL